MLDLASAFCARFDPECDVSLRTNHTIEVAVDCALAGHVAELLLKGRSNRTGSSEDHANAIDMAGYRCGSDEQVEAYLKWRCTVVRDTLRLKARWNAVTSVAEALLARKRLGYKEARAIYFEALVPRSRVIPPSGDWPSRHAVGTGAGNADLAGGA